MACLLSFSVSVAHEYSSRNRQVMPSKRIAARSNLRRTSMRPKCHCRQRLRIKRLHPAVISRKLRP